MRRTIAKCLLTATLFLTDCSQKSTVDLVITNISIIDIKDGSLYTNRNIIINNGLIIEIDSGRLSTEYNYRDIHDGENGFAIPGLWDMHAHPDDPEVWRMNPSDSDKELLLPLFVVNGITGIRDMAGDVTLINSWRSKIRAGELLGPKIFAGGPLLDGPNPMWDGSIGISDPDHVPQIVDSLVESGINFLKVYSLLPRDTYFALAKYANEISFPLAGHVPLTVLPSECATTGMKSQEHLLEILNETVSQKKGLDNLNTISDRLERYAAKQNYLIENFDTSKMDSLNALFVKHEIWHTPTLSMWYKNAWYEDELKKDDSLVHQLPEYLQRYWQVGVNDHLNNRDATAFIEAKKMLFNKYLDIVNGMNKAGVKLLTGTDMGANPLCFPGVGVHNELEFFVEAGLTPLEALRTATINPATFLNIQDGYGSVENNKFADIVILSSNPLTNISNVRNIRAVVRNGILIDKTKIESIISVVEEKFARE